MDTLKNLSAQWIAQIYVGIVSFMLNVYFARVLGPSAFGEFSVAIAYGGVLLILLDGGFRTALMRESVRETQPNSISVATLSSIANGNALTTSILIFIGVVIFFPNQLLIASTLIICFCLQTIALFTCSILRGRALFREDALLQILIRTTSALAIVITLHSGFTDSWQIFSSWAIGILFALVIFYRLMQSLPTPSFSFVYLKHVLPVMFIDLATAVYFRNGIVVMKYLNIQDHEIGLYSVAHRLIEWTIFIFNPIALLVFRKFRLNNLIIQPSVLRAILFSAALSFLLGVVFSAFFYLGATQLILTFYGNRYYQSIIILQILASSLPFVLANSILTQAALAYNLDKVYLYGALCAAIFSMVINLYFISLFGMRAAAFCMVATEAFLSIYLAVSIYRNLRLSATFRKTQK